MSEKYFPMEQSEYNLKNGLWDIIIQIALLLPSLGFLLGYIILGIDFFEILSAFWFLLIYLIIYQLSSMIVGAKRRRKFRVLYLWSIGLFMLGIFILDALNMTMNLGTILRFIVENFMGFLSVSYVFLCIWEYRSEKIRVQNRKEEGNLFENNLGKN